MYAIVDFMGKQFRIEKNKVVTIPYIAGSEIGSEIKMDKVLMVHDDKNISIGKPIITTAHVTAEIVEHNRDKKIIVFKKKRRKGYRKLQGHRQHYTDIRIKEINY